MSQWFEMEKEDISMSDDKKEVHIWFEQDNSGNRYVSVKTSDLIEVLAEEFNKQDLKQSDIKALLEDIKKDIKNIISEL